MSNTSVYENNNIKIVNRVGNSSKLRLGSNNALMAINAKDVLRLLEYNKDIQIIILEYIDVGEEDYIRRILGEYDIEIVSLCKDAMTKAKSTELGVRTVVNEDELYSILESKLGLHLGHKINWSKVEEKNEVDFSELIGSGDTDTKTEESVEQETGLIDISDDLKRVELENRVKELEEELNSKYNKLSELEDINSSLNKIIDELRERVDEYGINYGILELKLEGLEKAKEDYEEKISKLQLDIENKDKVNEELSVEINNITNELNNKIENVESKLNGKDIEIYSLESKVKELEKESVELQKEAEEYMDMAEKLKVDSAAEMGKSEALREELESCQITIEELERNLKEAGDKLSRFEDDSKTKEEELELRINNLVRINKDLEGIVEDCEKKIATLEQSADVGYVGNTNETLDELEINYTGSAKLINVFGFGGYGITTTSVSVAKKAAVNRALFIDLDIKSPKSNKLLNQVPLIEELRDIRDVQQRSGIGALVNKGAEYVLANRDVILKRCIETKRGYLDYMSGIYTKLDTGSFELNLPRFLNAVGNDYDYIIIDCGKIGQSDIQDWIIRGINKCGSKNIAVVNNDKLDVRNLVITMRDNQIDSSNTLCMLNFSLSTALDEDMKNSLKKYDTVIMPRDMNMYGENTTYDRVKILRDILSSVIEGINK